MVTSSNIFEIQENEKKWNNWSREERKQTEECAVIYEVTVVNEAKDAVFKILDLSKEGNEKELVHQCSFLLSALEELRESYRPLIDASNNQNNSHSGVAVSKKPR